MPDLKKMLTLEALSEALPSWLKRSTKPEYNADEIDSTLTTNQFVTASDKENWNAKGTYSKPSGGIPKSDLSSIVQTSLEKADSALQSETDPTVPTWAKQTNKPSYTQDEVSDGSTYKRVTQTEKDAWNGKQNAIPDLQTIRNGAAAGATAVQPDALATVEDQAMYAVTRTGKNCAVFPETHTVGSITFTCDIVTGYITSSASNDPRAWNLANRNISWSLPAGTYIVYAEAPDTNSARVEGYVFNGDTIVESIAVAVGGTNTVEITLTTSGSIGLELKPRTDKVRYMICPKSVFDTDPTYQPPSLTNVTITPALIEQVDGGAKNKCNWAAATENYHQSCSWTKTDTNLTVTSTGSWGHVRYAIGTLPKGDYVLSVKISSYSAESATCKLGIGSDAGSLVTISGNGTVSMNFTLASDSAVNLYFYANWNSGSYANTYVASEIMVSTKAAYTVSQKFVPYAMTNYELTQYTDGLKISDTLKTSGSLDDIKYTSFLKATSDVVGKPEGITSSCIVRTSFPMNDRTGGLQEIWTPGSSSAAYYRVCWGSQWGPWVRLN